MSAVRVRFAPSPTGALHIGGVRTALYNYLFARKHRGTFILRIEDTDQNRYVENAEKYIVDALRWCGIEPDEGPTIGGEKGPYRQSERSDIYKKYVNQLIRQGNAYYAFDTAEELKAVRDKMEAQKEVFKYGIHTRLNMRNSLTLSKEETEKLVAEGEYTVRIRIPEEELISFNDAIRGEVTFKSDELDDKIILKGDGLPTYHLANVVDDHLMEISHVIRGEEWLPSTGHHAYLYKFLGVSAPIFAHLPLILKPNGKGKLSKRDGAKLGIPVFPLSWNENGDSFEGFDDCGFEPEAALNFLALMSWNPGTEQEMFSLSQLEQSFDLDRIGKSGARFDYEKAKWFNQQYILASDSDDLATKLLSVARDKYPALENKKLSAAIQLMKERLTFTKDIFVEGYYLFEDVKEYDAKTVKKKWKSEKATFFNDVFSAFETLDSDKHTQLKDVFVEKMKSAGYGFGDVLPLLRVGLSGTMKGPDVFELISYLGIENAKKRMLTAIEKFENQTNG